ncbi:MULTISPECIES: DUF2474 family protein [unclassified Rhizobium]|uniref:DUF2474 family protein n=1 Tax=unclassified Rhizobium TaxID=2613769 RepID=UPI00177AE1A2|nr:MULTISPECIES: DUF2474 family protein [unclassified Rhizobium]MBD8688844.1 DUF2474 domain-containing protein [Rhizobium sp. CFBP 13644]MBD8694185.1 DUF2474 domain-containing protein [Rhizobium sp. CFBP 13717]
MVSGHVRSHEKAAHMEASDPIKISVKITCKWSRPHIELDAQDDECSRSLTCGLRRMITQQPVFRRLLWFVGIWLASMIVLTMAAYGIRLIVLR